MSKHNLPSPNMKGFSPPCVLACKKCGNKRDKVAFEAEQIKYDEQKTVFQISACCTFCGAVADKVNVNVVFMGVSNWQVIKSHVG